MQWQRGSLRFVEGHEAGAHHPLTVLPIAKKPAVASQSFFLLVRREAGQQTLFASSAGGHSTAFFASEGVEKSGDFYGPGFDGFDMYMRLERLDDTDWRTIFVVKDLDTGAVIRTLDMVEPLATSPGEQTFASVFAVIMSHAFLNRAPTVVTINKNLIVEELTFRLVP